MTFSLDITAWNVRSKSSRMTQEWKCAGDGPYRDR